MPHKNWLSSVGDEDTRLLNLSRSDLRALPADKLIDIIAWQQNGIEILDDKLRGAEADTVRLRGLIDRLSIDPNTGIFTSGALSVMNDVLIGSRILEFLKIQGFTLKLCVLDVDELKKHNSIGGHDAGDIVLEETARRLRMLFRRRSDVVAHGLADFIGDPKGAMSKEGTAVIGMQARADKGDEMIAWRFAAPIKNDLQRGGWRVEKEVARIMQGFEDATVSYPILQGLNQEGLKKLDPEGRFKVRSGIVTAPISVTFACVYSPMPINRTEVRRIIRKSDETVLLAKSRRHGKPPKGSEGEALTLTEDDLNLA